MKNRIQSYKEFVFAFGGLAISLVSYCFVCIFCQGIAKNRVIGFGPESAIVSHNILLKDRAWDKNYYFTTDGSAPNVESDNLENGIVLNRYTSKSNCLKVPTALKWYPPNSSSKGVLIRISKILGEKHINSNPKLFIFQQHVLPVVSLAVNYDDFFSNQKGIYVPGNVYRLRNYFNNRQKWWEVPGNYSQRGVDWEREVYFEYISAGGKRLFSEKALVNINGNSTRGFALKSLRVKFKKNKNVKKSKFCFFENNIQEKGLLLRNSGNDWERTLFADVLMHDLCKDLGFLTHESKHVIVYINGNYWGIHSMVERTDESLIGRTFKAKKKNVVVFEGNKVYDTNEQWISREVKSIMMNYIESKLSDSLKWNELSKKMNVQALITYSAAEIFFSNADWPNNNLKMYRIKNGKNEELWNFILHDLDFAMSYAGIPKSYERDMFAKINQSGSFISQFFSGLLKSKIFKQKLKNELLNLMETKLSEGTIVKRIEYYNDLLGPEMAEHVNRWRAPFSVEAWEQRCNEMIIFAQNRKRIVLVQMNNWLK